jgi:hypothetical protein
MKSRNGFFAGVNFSVIQHPYRTPTDGTDILEKAFHAGRLASFASLIVFGTGAERGTWGQFANVHVEGLTVPDARRALTSFTDIYSLALQNFGKTLRKRNFRLTQLQEIKPLLQAFGLMREFEDEWEFTKLFDEENGLPQEYAEQGRIKAWEERTYKAVISFRERVHIIRAAIVSALSQSPFMDNPDLVDNAFTQGLRGLSLGATDLEQLQQGQAIAA